MSTRPAEAAAGVHRIDPDLRIGAVALGVSDVSASADFYSHALGLALLARDADTVRLGPPQHDRAALVLHRVRDPVPASPHDTGLFHVAWLHPSRAELAATVERLLAGRWPIDGASDHGVSEALYLSDPDGLGIEIYADRPREQWPRTREGGEIAMFTRPLDVDDLLAQGPSEPTAAVAPAVVVGHVHLKVAHVARAAAFYRDVLGFTEQAHMPSAAFLAADGYHHHIGLNSWQSRGAHPAPANAPGLRLLTFELSDAEALGELGARLGPVGKGASGELRVSDPDGTHLAFRAAG